MAGDTFSSPHLQGFANPSARSRSAIMQVREAFSCFVPQTGDSYLADELRTALHLPSIYAGLTMVFCHSVSPKYSSTAFFAAGLCLLASMRA